MATHQTLVTAAAGDAWTLAYTAAGTVTLYVQNRSHSRDLLVRIGASTATSDSADAPADLMLPNESRAFPLVTGEKVHVRPQGAADNDVDIPVVLRV